jgi:hypothetical protein
VSAFVTHLALPVVQLIGALAEFKYGVTRWLLLHTNLGVAWLFNTAFSLLLVAGSSALVVGLAPAAVSSGVPEVMAYLNGVWWCVFVCLGRGERQSSEAGWCLWLWWAVTGVVWPGWTQQQGWCCLPLMAALVVAVSLVACVGSSEHHWGERRLSVRHTPHDLSVPFLLLPLCPLALLSSCFPAGVLLPKVFNIFTVVVKFASCALCVASGLPVGPEGPMIHLGAALGAALSQGHSTTLGFTTHLFRRFRNPRDKRDFVTAGVAVGVATAFNAPIGGLLFAFEEVASFWKHSLGWQVGGSREEGGGSRGGPSAGCASVATSM